MIHFDNHRISLLIALRGIGNHLLTEKREEEWTSNVWILRFAKDFCGVALWENSHDSDHSRWEKDISQSWRKKDVLHILVHSILLLPHCLLSVRQITLVPPNGHPSFKKMIIKVQGARRAKKLQQNSEKSFLSNYHFLDDDETLHYLDKKSRMIINLQPSSWFWIL